MSGEIGFYEVSTGRGGEDLCVAAAEELRDSEGVVLRCVRSVRCSERLMDELTIVAMADDEEVLSLTLGIERGIVVALQRALL